MASFVARMIPEAGGSLSDSPHDAFSDDTGSVHEHAITQLAAAGILRGTSSGVYGADYPIVRAQLASDRKSVLEEKRVSVPLDLGGRRIIKNKHHTTRLYNTNNI